MGWQKHWETSWAPLSDIRTLVTAEARAALKAAEESF